MANVLAPPLITSKAYWATIFAKKSHTVIHLCQPNCVTINIPEENQWQKSGNLNIQLLSALNLSCFSLYNVKIVSDNQSVVHHVNLFQSTKWSNVYNYNAFDITSAYEFIRQSWSNHCVNADLKEPLLITSRLMTNLWWYTLCILDDLFYFWIWLFHRDYLKIQLV